MAEAQVPGDGDSSPLTTPSPRQSLPPPGDAVDVVGGVRREFRSLLWTPPKAASVPNLVPKEQLTTANSLSLVAAYGTFPLAGVISAVLFKVAEWASHHYSGLHFLNLNKESVAIYADVVSFFVSAALISTITLQRPRTEKRERIDFSQTIRDVREGWSFIGGSPVVRS